MDEFYLPIIENVIGILITATACVHVYECVCCEITKFKRYLVWWLFIHILLLFPKDFTHISAMPYRKDPILVYLLALTALESKCDLHVYPCLTSWVMLSGYCLQGRPEKLRGPGQRVKVGPFTQVIR